MTNSKSWSEFTERVCISWAIEDMKKIGDTLLKSKYEITGDNMT